MLGAGVIGLGVGRFHCEGYMKAKGVKLKAVCDPVEERLSQAKREYNIDGYKDLDSLLRRNDIDIVSVCTPGHTHVDVATKVLRSGKHLLLEKPMALDLNGCDKIIREANKAGVKFSIDYEFRVNPLIREIKSLIDSKKIGKLAGISLYYWRGPFERTKPGKWIQKEKYSGGMLVEETCHWFDLIRWFGGKVKQVQCYTNGWIHPDFDFEDFGYINCLYQNGAIAQLAHVLVGFDYCFIIWVFGTEASIWAVQKDSKSSVLGVGDGDFYGLVVMGSPLRPNELPKIPPPLKMKRKFGEEVREHNNIRDYVRHFAQCVCEDKEPLVTAEDGKRSLELSLAAKESDRKKKIISLPRR